MATYGSDLYGYGLYGVGIMTGLAAGYANDINDYLLGGGAPTAIAAVWIKLHIGDPGSAGATNPAANTTRQQATFAASTGGSATNSGALSWASVPNTETYSHYTAWDASTAGNFLFSGALTAAVPVTAGQTFQIAAGQLTVDFEPVAA